jgi:hypothetical protein
MIMKVRITLFIFALLLVIAVPALLYAGTTGKIAGTITEESTGEPIVAANIYIEGRPLGAASDIDGSYAILNIPPGMYTVVVSMMGYQEVRFENVRVNIDLTTRIDATLQAQALEFETIVVTGERQLVIRDMTSSLTTTSADQIEALPVQQVTDILRLNAGIVESDGRLHIRGGRAGEVGYWVDGISATDIYDGRIGVTVENTAVQELQVISGTFNAEYGQAMSGIVNIITKEGSEKYSGQVKLYVGDYVSSDEIYNPYKSLVTEQDAATGLTKVVSSEREQVLEDFNPIFNGEISISGPVPMTKDKLTFFTNARYFYDEGYFYGIEWYRPNGTPGSNDIVAMNPSKRISFQGKLKYQLSNTISLTYNGFYNEWERDRTFYGFNSNDFSYTFNSHDYKYNPNGLPTSFGDGSSHIISLNHVLSSSTFYELRVNKYDTDLKQYVYKNSGTGNKYLVSVQEDTAKGIVAEVFDPTTAEGKDKLESIILLGGQYSYVPDPNGPVGYIHPNLINQPSSYSYMNAGMDITNTYRKTSYWIAKFDMTSQVNKANQLKFGSEVRLHELILNRYRIVPKTDANGQELTPFQPVAPAVGNIYRNEYNRKPIEISLYFQDKIEFNDIILNLGLRYDYFDSKSYLPADPADPNIYAPFKNEHKYANWVDMPADYDGTLGQYIQEKLDAGEIREYTPEERKSFMHKDVDAKMALSPRVGIAFPITSEGVIHFSYGHFLQIPEFQYLYSNPDYKITSGSGETLFGNPDLEPQKTVMYEIGLQQMLTDNISVDIILFYRDVRDWVGTSPLISTAKTGIRYSMFENKDYENVRGITLEIDKRLSGNYSFRASYTYQSAEGTYSNPTDAYNSALNNQAPVLALVPMNWDQTHTFNGQVIYDISDWTFSLIGRYWSGRPYTPQFARSETVGASAVTGLTNNSARRPNQTAVDLSINKYFRFKNSYYLNLFLNVYNLLDIRDETNVYTDTGTADYTTLIDPSRTPYHSDRVSTVEDYVVQPGWYTAPRQIHLGLMFGF